jgi:hypothetical protein
VAATSAAAATSAISNVTTFFFGMITPDGVICHWGFALFILPMWLYEWSPYGIHYRYHEAMRSDVNDDGRLRWSICHDDHVIFFYYCFGPQLLLNLFY